MSGQPAAPILGILCGLAEEARALGPWRSDPRVIVRLSAGRVDRAEAAVAEMRAAGVKALLSWGFCGGLDPLLSPGDVVECPADQVFPATGIVATPEAKAGARATGVRIVDMESGPVARAGLPAFAIRVVLDEAGFELPTPALVPLREDGRPDLARITLAILTRPRSLPGMIGLARRHRRALAGLVATRARVRSFIARLDPET